MLDQLLAHLYSALDKDPLAHPVARIALPGGHVREIRDDVLRVWRADGALVGEVALAGRSIAELLDALESLGMEVVPLDPAAGELSALALIEGRAIEDSPGGAYLAVPDSPLWHILRPIARELVLTGQMVSEARAQMYLRTASGEWLDFWGLFFGLSREWRSDDQYRDYLIAETLRPRSNPIAIELAVHDATGERISIYEPVFDLFRLSRSEMDVGRLRDAETWTHSVIVPTGPVGTNWSRVLPVVDRNRPAGVVIRGPVSVVPGMLADYDEENWRLLGIRGDWYSRMVFVPGDPRLGEYVLDVDEWTRNHRFNWYEARSHYGVRQDLVLPIYGPRTVDRASVSLSDGWRMGDPGALFGRGALIAVDGDWRSWLSDRPGLGDGPVGSARIVRFPEVFYLPQGVLVPAEPAGVVMTGMQAWMQPAAFAAQGGRLSVEALGQDEVTRAYRIAWMDHHASLGVSGRVELPIGAPRTTDQASIALSDGIALGDPGAAFGRGFWRSADGDWRMWLSDQPGLGNGTNSMEIVRLERLDQSVLGVLALFDAQAVSVLDGRADWYARLLSSGSSDALNPVSRNDATGSLSVFDVQLEPSRWGSRVWSDQTWNEATSMFGMQSLSA